MGTESGEQAQGARVGWVDGEHLYLDPDAALRAAQEMASDLERIPVTAVTLGKRLRDKGWLVVSGKDRDRILMRHMLEGTRRSVLHLRRGVLAETAQPSQSAQNAVQESPEHDLGPEPWAENRAAAEEIGPGNRPMDGPGRLGRAGPGTNGTIGPEAETYPGHRGDGVARGQPGADHLARQFLDLFGGETVVAEDPGSRP
jgi:hypothetical protein